MQCKYNVAMLQKAMFMLENVNNTFAIKPCMGRNSPNLWGVRFYFPKWGLINSEGVFSYAHQIGLS